MLVDYDVFIIDTIGIPYKFTAMQILPTLEAVLEIWVHYIRTCNLWRPNSMGPNYSHFAEATALVKLEAVSLLVTPNN
jgi:3-deoxy-D-manno-octulosonic-acid transferase